MPKLIDHLLNGEIEPPFTFTHEMPLTDAKHAYEIFKHKQEHCVKVLTRP